MAKKCPGGKIRSGGKGKGLGRGGGRGPIGRPKKRFTAVFILLIAIGLLVVGCQRGDLKISPVVIGQSAPHDGYNIGPELYLEEGDPVKVTGAVIWIKGTEPAELASQQKMR